MASAAAARSSLICQSGRNFGAAPQLRGDRAVTSHPWDDLARCPSNLNVPLRERNQLLLAGGYAPAYPQHGLDEPQVGAVRDALQQVLRSHEPFPAVVINRWWDMVDGNGAIELFVADCAPQLLEPPVNVLRPDPASRRRGATYREPRPVAGPPAFSSCVSARPRPVTPGCTSSRPNYAATRAAMTRPPRRPPISCCRFSCATKAGNCRSSASRHMSAPPTTSPWMRLTIEAFYPADAETEASADPRRDRCRRHQG